MNLTVQRADLLRIVARTHGVADKRGTSMPILGCVLLDAAGNQLRASATDLYLGARATTQAAIKNGGATCVAAKTLFDVVRNAPDGAIKLTLKNGALHVEAGRSHFKLPALDAADFPPLPNPDGGESGPAWRELDASVLAELIALTSYSMSSDDTRPHLAGTLFETDGRVARMVTTDGHRLSKAEISLGDVRSASPLEVLIPHRGIGELRKLVDEARADAKAAKAKTEGGARATIHVYAASGTAFFRRNDTNAHVTLSVKLVDERFPPYAKVIPAAPTKRVVCAREPLMAACKRISLVSNDKSHGVHLKLSSGALVLGASNVDVGEGAEEIDVEYEGEALEIGFNARYLLDALGALSTDTVVLELGGALDPGMIRQGEGGAAVAGGDVDFVGVVMPMRI